MTTFSLTKRPFVEDENQQSQLNSFSFQQTPFQSFENKRPIKQENKPDMSFKRPTVFPRLEISFDDLIEMTGKTSFTKDEVKELMVQAARIHERKLREEYDAILVDKLNEQYMDFAIYQRDYLMKQYGESNATYFN